MNNPIRRLVQEGYEIRKLRGMSHIKSAGNALEIGCGSGNGSRLIKKYFFPHKIIAIDLDEKMIRLAKKRHSDLAEFLVMDAAKLDFSDKAFDTVFDFGIIHHIPNWRDCLKELRRVLKPGGELILEDLSIDSFSFGAGRLWRILSDHPYESMYSAREFTDYLKTIGFEILNYGEYNPLKFIRHFSLNAVKR